MVNPMLPKLNPEDFEPNTVRAKDSICPLIGDKCPKDPKLCGRYQPFNIVEVKLNVPQVKMVYMCVDDALRITAETILTTLQTMAPTKGHAGMGQGFTDRH